MWFCWRKTYLAVPFLVAAIAVSKTPSDVIIEHFSNWSEVDCFVLGGSFGFLNPQNVQSRYVIIDGKLTRQIHYIFTKGFCNITEQIRCSTAEERHILKMNMERGAQYKPATCNGGFLPTNCLTDLHHIRNQFFNPSQKSSCRSCFKLFFINKLYRYTSSPWKQIWSRNKKRRLFPFPFIGACVQCNKNIVQIHTIF